MINCIYCHKLLKSINRGNVSVSGTCKSCDSWFLYEDEELSMIEISRPYREGTVCVVIRPYLNTIDIETDIETKAWNITIPLTWIFPSTVDDLIYRYSNLKVFF